MVLRCPPPTSDGRSTVRSNSNRTHRCVHSADTLLNKVSREYWIPSMSPSLHLSACRVCVGIATFAIAFSFSVQPVSAQQPGPVSKVAEKINPANWKLPSFRLPNFLVPQDEQSRIVQRKDGLVQDIKGTASRSWQRTKATFNPARLNPMNLFAGAAGPSNNGGEKKPGFFSSLLSPPVSQPTERVATVNEFLGQSRP